MLMTVHQVIKFLSGETMVFTFLKFQGKVRSVLASCGEGFSLYYWHRLYARMK